MHCKVHWRVAKRLGSCRLISVQPLIGSNIRAFSLSSALYTLRGLIRKVVASHAEGCKVARSNPGCGRAAPIYTMHEAPLSDAIVRSWLWLTATRSSPLGYFSRLLQVVDN